MVSSDDVILKSLQLQHDKMVVSYPDPLKGGSGYETIGELATLP